MDNQLTESTIDNQVTESTIDSQLTESTIDNQVTEATIRVKLRRGQYIVTVDKLRIGSIDLNFHANKCLKQHVFNALRKNTVHRPRKPRKLDTVANLTAEQLERNEHLDENITIITKSNLAYM